MSESAVLTCLVNTAKANYFSFPVKNHMKKHWSIKLRQMTLENKAKLT